MVPSPPLQIRFELFETGLAVFYPDGEPFQEPEEILVERDQARQAQTQTQEKLDRALAKLNELGIDPNQVWNDLLHNAKSHKLKSFWSAILI